MAGGDRALFCIIAVIAWALLTSELSTVEGLAWQLISIATVGAVAMVVAVLTIGHRH